MWQAIFLSDQSFQEMTYRCIPATLAAREHNIRQHIKRSVNRLHKRYIFIPPYFFSIEVIIIYLVCQYVYRELAECGLSRRCAARFVLLTMSERHPKSRKKRRFLKWKNDTLIDFCLPRKARPSLASVSTHVSIFKKWRQQRRQNP